MTNCTWCARETESVLNNCRTLIKNHAAAAKEYIHCLFLFLTLSHSCTLSLYSVSVGVYLIQSQTITFTHLDVLHAYNSNTKIWLHFVSFRSVSFDVRSERKKEFQPTATTIATITHTSVNRMLWWERESVYVHNIISNANNFHARKSVPRLLHKHKQDWRLTIARTHIHAIKHRYDVFYCMFFFCHMNWTLKLAVIFVLYPFWRSCANSVASSYLHAAL